MDTQLFINILLGLLSVLFGLVLTAFGWYLSNLSALVKSLQEQLAALSVEVAKSYVPRPELEKVFTRIFDALDEIRKQGRVGQ